MFSLTIIIGDNYKLRTSPHFVGWPTSAGMTLYLRVDSILLIICNKSGNRLFIKDSFSGTLIVRQECAFGAISQLFDTVSCTFYYFRLLFLQGYKSKDTRSICEIDFCSPGICSGFREGSFFDNEVAFWGCHSISEVFSVFFDVVTDVVQVLEFSCHWSVIGVPSLKYSLNFHSSNRWKYCDIIHCHSETVALCYSSLWQQFLRIDELSIWFWVGAEFFVIRRRIKFLQTSIANSRFNELKALFVSKRRSASVSLSSFFSRSEWCRNQFRFCLRQSCMLDVSSRRSWYYDYS